MKATNLIRANDDLLLTGTIFLANVSYSGLLEYAVKAAIGGVIWFGFKIVYELISDKIKRKNKEK